MRGNLTLKTWFILLLSVIILSVANAQSADLSFTLKNSQVDTLRLRNIAINTGEVQEFRADVIIAAGEGSFFTIAGDGSNGGEAAFFAKREIILDPGFIAESGSRFEASIDTAFMIILAPGLLQPADGATGVATNTLLHWEVVDNALSYRLQVALNTEFSETAVIFDESGLETTTHQLNNLAENTTYYWRVSAVNAAGSSDWSPPSLFTTVSAINLNNTFFFQTRDNPTDYSPGDFRLIGLPGDSVLPAAPLFSGDFNEDWKIAWDNGAESSDAGDYQVISAELTFEKGKALWALNKGNLNIDLTVPAASLNDSGEINIPLHPGWNLITNPLTQTVGWIDVQIASVFSEPLFEFRGNDGYVAATTLEPFAGYYFDNAGNLPSLKIPYPHVADGSVSTEATDPANWRIHIGLISGKYSDNIASIGVAASAKTTRDHLDFRKPRDMFNSPAIAFYRPQWGGRFITDIRPLVEEAETWEFEVSALPGIRNTLSFSGVRRVPSRFDVYLVDRGGARFINLREDTTYHYNVLTHRARFELAIGKKAALNDLLTAVIPKTISLGENYPNPFNPATIIPLDIPTKTIGELGIYNILGERLKLIFSGVLESGRHGFTWDGRNHSGAPVASGVYFYRFTTQSGFLKVRKMVLLR